MRTIRIKLYKFSELSKEAKQNAMDNYLKNEDFQWISSEAAVSLKLFAKSFDIDIDTFDFDETYRNKYTFGMTEEILELTGKRLIAYLHNNYSDILYERKHYGEYTKRENGKWRYGRYSKCQLQQTCCPFSGVCYDEDLLHPIRKRLRKAGSMRMDFKELLEDCLSSLSESVMNEIAANQKESAIAEHFEANEYEFTKEGSIH